MDSMKLSLSKRPVISSYQERPMQKALRHLCSQNRFNVLVIHRRAGKTVFAINKLIRDVLTEPRHNARGHYFAPTPIDKPNLLPGITCVTSPPTSLAWSTTKRN
jgi:hypothetical protein